jgi:hypothetical protein
MAVVVEAHCRTGFQPVLPSTGWKPVRQNAPVRHFSLLLFLLFSAIVTAQSPILQRRVTVHAENVRLSTALGNIAKDGGFKLSYNAAVVPADSTVTIHAVDEKVQNVLKDLLPPNLQWKESGGHLIITGSVGRKQKFTTTGSVVDASTGGPIARATILEARRNNAAITDDRGAFSVSLSGEFDRTPVLIARHGYRDTIVYVGRNGHAGRIALEPLDELERLQPICEFERCGVEDLGMTRLLVPASRMDQAANIDFIERRPFQLSLVPSVSTNGPIAGSVVNQVSVNILGGYARGVEGVEIGGGFNLLSGDMTGLQVSGLANLVGGHTRGVQLSGGINHSMRSLEGLQFAGFGNTVWDTLSGWQVAGGINVVKRGMSGTQVSGLGNVSLDDLDGVQVSCGLNVTHGTVNKAQVAGALNYARSVKGGQVTAGLNMALDSVGGGQVGFGANYAGNVSGGQVSFGANVVPGHVSGGQVGFGLNYAGNVTGGQFSFGANIVPGTVDAGQVGFGLNYAGNIIGGQFSFGANIVPGTVHGGQVGALNFGRRVHGAQVGFLNLSDTLSGGAVGLLTISLKGYHRFDVVSGDIFPLSLHVRTGTRVFHNILGYSPPVSTDERWGFLYGFGFEPRFGKSIFVNIDVTGEQIVEQRAWVDAWNVLGRFSITPGVRFSDRLFISAGPVLNVLASDWRDADTGAYLSALPPASLNYEEVQGDTRISVWVGWKAGVGVRF